MKKALFIFLALICSSVVFADEIIFSWDFEKDTIKYKILNDKEVQVAHIGRSFTKRYVTIPETVDGYTVIGIGKLAAYNCEELCGISLPNTIRYIKNEAFRNSAIYHIDLPESITEIDSLAFAYCTNLTSIKLPAGVKIISERLFEGCRNLSNLEFSGDIEFQRRAFAETNITSFEIPRNVRTIVAGLFAGCKSLKTVKIHDKVTSIGGGAFGGCESIEAIECNNVKSIGNYAFRGCSALESVTAENIEAIDYSAFADCTSLKAIPLGEKTTFIDYNCFKNCTNLKSIYIPANVDTIGYGILEGCSNIETIEVNKANKRYTIIDNVLIDTKYKSIIACPAKKEGDFHVPEDILSIEGYAFSCSMLSNIYLPEGLENIGGWAFERSAITSMKLPSSLKNRGISAIFDRCSNLSEVILGGNLEIVDYVDFAGCISLKRLTLSQKIKVLQISERASGCVIDDIYDYSTDIPPYITNSKFCKNYHIPKGYTDFYRDYHGRDFEGIPYGKEWEEINLVDDLDIPETDNINAILEKTPTKERIYNALGTKMENLYKGLNIIRGNKTAKKIFVK